MGEPLIKQPLIEALCEFQFSPIDKWDSTVSEIFYDQVKSDFPERKPINQLNFQVDQLNVQLTIGQESLQNIPESLVSQRLQFKRSDNSAVVQVGSDLLAINHLQPYRSWEDFRSLILKMFSIYVEICNIKRLERINLRYINHISTPEGRFEIEQFLTVFPIFPSPINIDLSSFSQVYNFEYVKAKATLKHHTGIIQTTEGQVGLLLDLDFMSREIESFEDQSALIYWLKNWLNEAHDFIESAFIASLNPDYYESLK